MAVPHKPHALPEPHYPRWVDLMVSQMPRMLLAGGPSKHFWERMHTDLWNRPDDPDSPSMGSVSIMLGLLKYWRPTAMLTLSGNFQSVWPARINPLGEHVGSSLLALPNRVTQSINMTGKCHLEAHMSWKKHSMPSSQFSICNMG